MRSTSITNGMKESHAASIVGMKMLRVLPPNSSRSVVGVASKRFQAFVHLSPTRVYEAMIVGNTPAYHEHQHQQLDQQDERPDQWRLAAYDHAGH